MNEGVQHISAVPSVCEDSRGGGRGSLHTLSRHDRGCKQVTFQHFIQNGKILILVEFDKTYTYCNIQRNHYTKRYTLKPNKQINIES